MGYNAAPYMSWLSQADRVPLEDGSYSFHNLALRWMLLVTGMGDEGSGTGKGTGTGPERTGTACGSSCPDAMLSTLT